MGDTNGEGVGGRFGWVTLRPRSVFTAVVVLAGLLTACDPNRFVSGWVPYWGGSGARSAYSDPDDSMLFSEVSPFWYSATGVSTITRVGTTGDLTAAVNAARQRGLPVLPSITDGTAKGEMAAILASPSSRTAHVTAVVNLVMTGHAGAAFDGIDLDYEGFAFTDGSSTWATTRPNWVAFVQQLAAELQARGKLLSVTIPPEWGTVNPSTGRAQGYWVYAQELIAPSVDRLRLMVYDWSVGSPGPIAPMFWVDQVIAFSGARVPPAKLQLGVPLYGRHWRTQANSQQTCPDGALGRASVTTANAAGLLARHGRTATRHSSGEMSATWTVDVTGSRTAPIPPPVDDPPSSMIESIDASAGHPVGLQPAKRLTPPDTFVTCQVRHTVYFPDAQSVLQRANAAVAAEWSGIVVWALGYENTTVLDALWQVAPQRPNGEPTGSLDSWALTGNSLRLTGWAADPEFDLPVAVRVDVGGGGSSRTVLARLERGDVAAAWPGIGPFHGFDTTVDLPADRTGPVQVCVTILGWTTQPSTPLACITAG